jgi:hypothetical protein
LCQIHHLTRPQSINPNADPSIELAAVVDDLLNQLNTKFSSISSELLGKSTYLLLSTPASRNVNVNVHVGVYLDVDVANLV